MFDFLDSWVSHPFVLVLILIIGFAGLVKGADWLVDGSSAMAKQFNVSNLIIGLTVVAFGTSMPEFVVNMVSSASANSELAITNVLGSNAINIFVVLGLTALIWPVKSDKDARNIDIPVAIAASLLVLLLAAWTLPHPSTWKLWEGFRQGPLEEGCISKIGGGILLAMFIIYMVCLTMRAKAHPDSMESEVKTMSVGQSQVYIVGGLICLAIGGEFVVKAATRMASDLGVSDGIIGLTVVALGTSLPELATSIIAAYKHNSDLALGNCVGSCIFNIYFVLAISALASPLKGYAGIGTDAMMSCIGPLVVWLWTKADKKHMVSRGCGATLLAIYTGYLIYRIATL